MVRIFCVLLAGIAAPLVAQQQPWLREVAELRASVRSIVSADIAADGSSIVVLTAERDVVQYSLDPWREMQRFRLSDDGQLRDIRMSPDRRHVVVTVDPAGDERRPLFVHRLSDGARVRGESPELPEIDARMPPAAYFPLDGVRPDVVRAARGGNRCVFRIGSLWRVWRDTCWRALGSPAGAGTAALTGDGEHLLVTQDDQVEVVSVTSQDRWALPAGFVPNSVVRPFGPRGEFVVVDRERIRIADAHARRILHEIQVSQRGVGWTWTEAVAASAEGRQVAVSGYDGRVEAVRVFVFDTATTAVAELAQAAHGIDWCETTGGLLLREGSACCVSRELRWTWLPPRDQARVWHDEFAQVDALVLPHSGGVVASSVRGRPIRRDARNGQVLAVSNREDLWPLAAVGEYVLMLDHSDSPGSLELRRQTDLRLVESGPPLRSELFPQSACSASGVDRVALQYGDAFVIADLAVERPRAK